MKSGTVLLSVFVLSCVCGCAPVISMTGTLFSLDTSNDQDEDGFFELAGPEITEETGVVGATIANTITQAAAEQIAGVSLPDFVGIVLSATVTRTYADGSEFTDVGSRTLGSFSLPVEFACPDSIEVTFDVDSETPVLGATRLFSTTISATSSGGAADVRFDCNSLIFFEAIVDDTGNATFAATVVPF